MADGNSSTIAFISQSDMNLLAAHISAAISVLKDDIYALQKTTNDGLYSVSLGIGDVSQGITTLNRDMIAQMLIEIERLTSVKNEITRTIEVDAQANIMEHFSNLSEDLAVIHASFQRIKKEHSKTFTRLARINAKFDAANEQVKESYVKDITRLGKYIFEVWELHYLKTIYLRLKSQHIELFRNSTATMEKIKSRREEIISDLLKAADEKITEFEKNRAAFDFACQNFKNDAFKFTGSVELPVTLVESLSHKSFFNQDIFQDPENEKVKIKLFDKSSVDMTKLFSKLNWRNMSESELKEMENNLTECSNQGFISNDYLNFLLVALKNNPPLTVESVKI